MRYLWLAWLPLLYLPNLGLGGPTGYGSLELSDFLIWPYLALVAIGCRPRWGLAIEGPTASLLGFAAWCLLSTLLVRERYGYADHTAVLVGLLKLGRLMLYAVAAILTAWALADETSRRLFPWSLTAAGVVVAFSLMTVHDTADALHLDRASSGYKAENAISVMMAIVLCYLGALSSSRGGTRRWRELSLPAMALMVPGFLLSHGRGGWFAALAGVVYFFYRRGLGVRILVGLAVCSGLVAATYETVPTFRKELDATIWPDQEFMARYHAGVAGFDDGARLTTWSHEFSALVRSPLLGAGFFHRGGLSGLWGTGSHNFFLQMFLETGIVGGLLMIAVCLRLWRAAGAQSPEATSVRTALVAAAVGGLTGEYFYGGMVLFTLLAVFAPVGSLPPKRATAPETQALPDWILPGGARP